MKTMNKRKRSVRLLAFFLCALLFASCSHGTRHTKEEMQGVLGELLPMAEEINVIYFGEGLPTNLDVNAVRAFYESFDTDVKSISYTPVDPDSGFENIDDIKEATLAVFTEGYAQVLFDRAFTGISAVFEEGLDSEHRETAVYAMYMEQDGYLTERVNLKEDAIPLGRKYDLGSLEIIRENESGVLVKLASTFNGEKSADVELWVVETENGWRLDSPTY